MRIACPACAAAYDVPEERLRPGRTVRCARCGTAWMPVGDAAPEPVAAPAPAVAPVEVPEPVVEEPVMEAPPPVAPAIPTIVVPPDPPRTRRRVGLAAAWVASLVVLGALAAGAVVEREAVMGAWPASARLYGALGLTNARTP